MHRGRHIPLRHGILYGLWIYAGLYQRLQTPNKATDHIVLFYDSHSAYLVIVGSALRRVWTFLTSSKEPPIHILNAFMKNFGKGTCIICMDQDSKLAHSNAFRESMLKDFGYMVRQLLPKWRCGNLQWYTCSQSPQSPLRIRPTCQVLVCRTTPHHLPTQPVGSFCNKKEDPLQQLAGSQTGHHSPQNVQFACVYETVWLSAL
jgi:hypothetical protein